MNFLAVIAVVVAVAVAAAFHERLNKVLPRQLLYCIKQNVGKFTSNLCAINLK